MPDVVVVADVVAVSVSVAVVPVPVVAVDEASVPVVDVAADSVDDSPDDVELELLVVDDSEDVPVVSAAANPWPVATAVTSHAATAMPPYPPSFAALWAALRDGLGVVDALDEGEANRGLTGRWISVMGSTPMAFQWWDLPLIDRSNSKVAHVYHDPKFRVNPWLRQFLIRPPRMVKVDQIRRFVERQIDALTASSTVMRS